MSDVRGPAGGYGIRPYDLRKYPCVGAHSVRPGSFVAAPGSAGEQCAPLRENRMLDVAAGLPGASRTPPPTRNMKSCYTAALAPSVRELAAKRTEGESLAFIRNFKTRYVSLPHPLAREPPRRGGLLVRVGADARIRPGSFVAAPGSTGEQCAPLQPPKSLPCVKGGGCASAQTEGL